MWFCSSLNLFSSFTFESSLNERVVNTLGSDPHPRQAASSYKFTVSPQSRIFLHNFKQLTQHYSVQLIQYLLGQHSCTVLSFSSSRRIHNTWYNGCPPVSAPAVSATSSNSLYHVVSLSQFRSTNTSLANNHRIWGLIDYYVNKYYTSKYRPAVRGSRTRTSSSVSIVVRTLQPPPIFKECLISWMRNNPLEIIISTTAEHHAAVNDIVREAIKEINGLHPRIEVITSAEGARIQLHAGVQKAEGEIIATTDNHILWGPGYLHHMLPCFDDSRVSLSFSITWP